MSTLCAVANCVVGGGQAAAGGPSDTTLFFLGAQLSPAAAAAALTVYDGPEADNIVLSTLASPASGVTAVTLGGFCVPTQSKSIFYNLTGVGATAQIFWKTG